ncbi:MAG: NAD(P)H-dependent oxidoreductase [Alphaproteobacteria bacterium]|nr:NAD(P)H-dependent oxidoreductase [Alphaproteobacteria bacterium]
MKKILFGIIALVASTAADAKTLVAYFSRSGNTELVANQIAAATGADTFRIETMDENFYPSDYTATTEQAKQEIADGTLPEIKPVPDMSEYDVVFIGSPVWWGCVATPVKTFLVQNAMTGKTVVPFNTHAGSGTGNVHTDINEMTAFATAHLDGIAIVGSDAPNSSETVNTWLKQIGQISE